MKNKVISIIILICYSCVVPNFEFDKEKQLININYDYYFMEDGSIYFDIFYSIPYEELVFIKNKDGFSSNLVSSIYIKDEDDNIIFSDSWSENIVFDYFEKTKSSLNHVSNFSVNLQENSTYIIHIELNDYYNKKHWSLESNLETHNFEKLSDLKLFFKENNTLLSVDNLKNDKYENIDTLWVKYQIIDDIIHENGVSFSIQENSINSKKNKFSIKIDASELYPYEINLVPISLDGYSSGRITINCYYNIFHKQKTMIFSNKKLIEHDYTILIKPMEYLLNKKSYIEYNTLDSLQKIDFIYSYWNQDNNMGLLDEFYSRVIYANMNFKSIKNDGSQSDKGKIYIIYGRPIDIDYNFTQNGDFEIWYYVDKKFIFINRFGYYECYKC